MHSSTTILLLAGVIVLAIAALWVLPGFQLQRARNRFGLRRLPPADLLKAENDRRSTLAQILTGLAILVGLYFTSQTLRMQEQGQLTDRINKAVQQAGDDKITVVRLGGVYQLARIAADSETDRWPMLRVMLSVAEQRSPLPEMTRTQVTELCNPSEKYDYTELPDSTVDAVASSLPAFNPVSKAKGQVVTVRHSRLRAVDWSGIHFGQVILVDDDLTGDLFVESDFGPYAKLSHSIFAHANLTKAQMPDADLYYSCLVRAELTGANLRGAKLQDADVRRIPTAKGADFTGASLQRTDLRGANLREATGFTREQLSEAILDCNTRLPAEFASLVLAAPCPI